MSNGVHNTRMICSKKDTGSRTSDGLGSWMVILAVLLSALGCLAGCSVRKYRLNADQETYGILTDKLRDPRWSAPRIGVEPAEHARFADRYNPDCPPMPPDDPAAHRDMHCPAGIPGYKHWHKFGDAPWIEDPAWRQYLEFSEDGSLALTRDRAIELALVNSREYQTELEDLYLACLALTTQRFEFSLQWFLVGTGNFFHFGSGPTDSNALNPTTLFGFRKALSGGGQILADFSNSFVWQYSGTDSLAVRSNIGLDLVQPLLRNAGRNIRLEELTQAERNVLYAARDFARFRKQFYFDVTAGNAGYLDLLQRLQNIRNFAANVFALEQDLIAHQALSEAGLVSRLQVDQVFQGYQSGKLALVRSINEQETAVDFFMVRLGLPPSIPVLLDDSLLTPFKFVDQKVEELEAELTHYLTKYRETEGEMTVEQVREGLTGLTEFHRRIEVLLATMPEELEMAMLAGASDQLGARKSPAVVLAEPARLEEIRSAPVGDPVGAKDQPSEELQTVENNWQLSGMPSGGEQEQEWQRYRNETLQEAKSRLQEIQIEMLKLSKDIESTAQQLTDANRIEMREALLKLIRRNLSIVSELYVLQTRIRAYHVELQKVDLQVEAAIQIALMNRLDLLNQRARVVDEWRQIQIAANRLKGFLDINVNGDIATEIDSDNPFDFSSSASGYRAGLRFDAPLNRQFERNAYRAQLIEFQRSRRSYMAAEDRVVREVRRDMRNLATNRVNFEIARQSLITAARQVEEARDQLLLPGPASDSSQTQDTLNALNSMLQAKNALISIWVDYETTRVQLLLDLEALQPDPSLEPADFFFNPVPESLNSAQDNSLPQQPNR